MHSTSSNSMNLGAKGMWRQSLLPKLVSVVDAYLRVTEKSFPNQSRLSNLAKILDSVVRKEVSNLKIWPILWKLMGMIPRLSVRHYFQTSQCHIRDSDINQRKRFFLSQSRRCRRLWRLWTITLTVFLWHIISDAMLITYGGRFEYSKSVRHRHYLVVLFHPRPSCAVKNMIIGPFSICHRKLLYHDRTPECPPKSRMYLPPVTFQFHWFHPDMTPYPALSASLENISIFCCSLSLGWSKKSQVIMFSWYNPRVKYSMMHVKFTR